MPGSFMKINDVMADTYEIDLHDGYLAPFSRQRYELAKFANGTRVRKVWEDVGGDLTKVGSTGTVLGSIGHPALEGALYFVEWDDKPRMPTALIESKLTTAGPIQRST